MSPAPRFRDETHPAVLSDPMAVFSAVRKVKYIATAQRSRSRIEIEREAKIGANGGAVYRQREAEDCFKMEGRETEKVRACSRCKMVSIALAFFFGKTFACFKAVYCNAVCQKKGVNGP